MPDYMATLVLAEYIKGTVHPKIKLHIFPVVLFICIDSFGVSCLVLEISAIEISAFTQI